MDVERKNKPQQYLKSGTEEPYAPGNPTIELWTAEQQVCKIRQSSSFVHVLLISIQLQTDSLQNNPYIIIIERPPHPKQAM